MPRQKDLKRVVRTRMQKTGEAYTTARMHLLAKRQEPVEAAVAAAPAPSYADLAGMTDAKVAEKTGCTWERWVYALDRHGAAEMTHREIAQLVHDKYRIGSWWTQTVAVGYERIKGLREKGQRRDGGFEAHKSKTFAVPASRLFAVVTRPSQLERWLPEALAVRTKSKDRSARIGMRDGTIAAFWLTGKGEAKTSLAVQQGRLPDKESAERAKRYWAERLAALAELVA
jgi:hypothetical protein